VLIEDPFCCRSVSEKVMVQCKAMEVEVLIEDPFCCRSVSEKVTVQCKAMEVSYTYSSFWEMFGSLINISF